MTNNQNNRSPWKFFLLTFAYSWLIWIPSVLDGLGLELPFNVAEYSTVVVIIGAFAPLMAAITLVAGDGGWKGIKSFLGQALDFHIKPVYLILALVLPLVIHVIAHYLAYAVGLDVAQTLFPTEISIAPVILAIPYFLLMLVIGGGQEEFGWRGYAQEPLQEKNRGHSGKFGYRCDLGYLAFTFMVYDGRFAQRILVFGFRDDDNQHIDHVCLVV